MQQAIDAAEIDEGAVVGEVLHHACHVLAFLQRLEQRFALLAVLLLEHRAPGNHDVVALLVELDDLELQRPALQVGRLAQGANVHQGTGQEGADVVDVNGEAALDLAVDDAGDDLRPLKGVLQHLPGLGPLGLFAGQPGLAPAVVHDLHRHLDLVADREGELAGLAQELVLGDDPLGFQAGVNDDPFVVDIDHRAGDDGARHHLDGA